VREFASKCNPHFHPQKEVAQDAGAAEGEGVVVLLRESLQMRGQMEPGRSVRVDSEADSIDCTTNSLAVEIRLDHAVTSCWVKPLCPWVANEVGGRPRPGRELH
jgi:hypothetical protein